MSNSSEQRQHCLRFQGAWKTPLLAAYGCAYLNDPELIDKRSGLQIAIGSMFGPAGLATQGGSVEEVEVAIAKARVIFENQMTNARMIVDAPAQEQLADVAPASSNGVAQPQATKGRISAGRKSDFSADEDDVLIPMD